MIPRRPLTTKCWTVHAFMKCKIECLVELMVTSLKCQALMRRFVLMVFLSKMVSEDGAKVLCTKMAAEWCQLQHFHCQKHQSSKLDAIQKVAKICDEFTASKNCEPGNDTHKCDMIFNTIFMMWMFHPNVSTWIYVEMRQPAVMVHVENPKVFHLEKSLKSTAKKWLQNRLCHQPKSFCAQAQTAFNARLDCHRMSGRQINCTQKCVKSIQQWIASSIAKCFSKWHFTSLQFWQLFLWKQFFWKDGPEQFWFHQNLPKKHKASQKRDWHFTKGQNFQTLDSCGGCETRKTCCWSQFFKKMHWNPCVFTVHFFAQCFHNKFFEMLQWFCSYKGEKMMQWEKVWGIETKLSFNAHGKVDAIDHLIQIAKFSTVSGSISTFQQFMKKPWQHLSHVTCV